MKKQSFELRAEHIVIGLVLVFVYALVTEFAKREGMKLGDEVASRVNRYW